ncbi:MAG: hypothetical protein WC943_16595, partial [Elusimicrobiota bacterium]
PPAPRTVAPVPASRALSESERIEQIDRNPKLTKDQKALLRTFVPEEIAEARQEVKDRAELVLPPPPGWKSEDIKHKFKLTLIAEKAIIRKGEKFRFRLEIQNVGSEHKYFIETCPSFMKSGVANDSRHLEFFATPPSGQQVKMLGAFPSGDFRFTEHHFPDHWTEEQKIAELKRRQVDSQAACQLNLRLEPGETLVTKPDLPPPNKFRGLGTSFEFDKPGTYRIKAVYDDVGDHPDVERERDLQKQERSLHMSRQELLESDERIRLKQGISLEQVQKEREERIALYEENKRTAVGCTESNSVVVEVVP